MKRLSNGRSSSKTRPARFTEHFYEPQDDEPTTQKVKLVSLHEEEDVDDDEAVAEDQVEEEQEEDEDESGYASKQKHKKIWKISSIKNGVNNKQQSQQQEKFICIKCGKGFQSLKAKCGHMACHSQKEKAPTTNLVSKQKLSMKDSQSDTESGARQLTRRTKYKKHTRAKVDVYKNCSSDDSGVEQEQEDGAISLMLLSRDSTNWGGLNSVEDSSDDNSVVLEARSISTKLAQKHGLNLKKCASKKVIALGDYDSLKAEGSPHLSLKKLKRVLDFTAAYESGENSFETDETRKGKGILEQHHLSNVGDKWKKGKHECPVCFKVFKSGQALGGHRRVHLSEGSDEVSETFKQNGTHLRDLIDLNLPAPMEDDEASKSISMASYRLSPTTPSRHDIS